MFHSEPADEYSLFPITLIYVACVTCAPFGFELLALTYAAHIPAGDAALRLLSDGLGYAIAGAFYADQFLIVSRIPFTCAEGSRALQFRYFLLFAGWTVETGLLALYAGVRLLDAGALPLHSRGINAELVTFSMTLAVWCAARWLRHKYGGRGFNCVRLSDHFQPARPIGFVSLIVVCIIACIALVSEGIVQMSAPDESQASIAPSASVVSSDAPLSSNAHNDRSGGKGGAPANGQKNRHHKKMRVAARSSAEAPQRSAHASSGGARVSAIKSRGLVALHATD